MTSSHGSRGSGARGGERAPEPAESRRARKTILLLTLASAVLIAGAAAATPDTKFVSKRYGYSIVLPGSSSRWSASFASSDWTSDSIGGLASSEMDAFTDARTGRTYLLAARPSRSLERWTAFVVSAHPSPLCGAARFLPDSTLAGSRARVHTVSCSDGYRVFVATALHGRRGYMLLVASPTALSRAADLHAFDAARRSFRFLTR